MGLDVTAYRMIAPAPEAELDEGGYPVEWDSYIRITPELIQLTEQNFPGRTQGLAPGVFGFVEAMDLRAGSYGGYSLWRDWLAKLVGFQSATDYWKRADSTSPFWELINFSDCEGYLGPVACAALVEDFARFTPDGNVYENAKYQEWAQAVAIGADGGFLLFH